ncbi:MAG: hypothetical protein Q7U96_02780, partial [Chloroflexota bacterium]|nr:hypothetical protein [Chloroflexota bacterium]
MKRDRYTSRITHHLTSMARTIKHFSLHRIAGTELRVVADVEEGTLPVVQAEETVLRRYVQREAWPHRWVTLFILQDLQPLVRQLTHTPTSTLPPPYQGEGS